MQFNHRRGAAGSHLNQLSGLGVSISVDVTLAAHVPAGAGSQIAVQRASEAGAHISRLR
jgi:hypothetical protein